MPGGSAGAVRAHERTLQGAEQSLWKTERFERAEVEDWEIVKMIKNIGHGGYYALYFCGKWK